jgi:hypothetical protein
VRGATHRFLIWIHAGIACVLVAIFGCWHHREKPYRWAFQNTIETTLFFVDAICIFLGIAYTMVTEYTDLEVPASIIEGALLFVIIGSLLASITYLFVRYRRDLAVNKAQEQDEQIRDKFRGEGRDAAIREEGGREHLKRLKHKNSRIAVRKRTVSGSDQPPTPLTISARSEALSPMGARTPSRWGSARFGRKASSKPALSVNAARPSARSPQTPASLTLSATPSRCRSAAGKAGFNNRFSTAIRPVEQLRKPSPCTGRDSSRPPSLANWGSQLSSAWSVDTSARRSNLTPRETLDSLPAGYPPGCEPPAAHGVIQEVDTPTSSDRSAPCSPAKKGVCFVHVASSGSPAVPADALPMPPPAPRTSLADRTIDSPHIDGQVSAQGATVAAPGQTAGSMDFEGQLAAAASAASAARGLATSRSSRGLRRSGSRGLLGGLGSSLRSKSSKMKIKPTVVATTPTGSRKTSAADATDADATDAGATRANPAGAAEPSESSRAAPAPAALAPAAPTNLAVSSDQVSVAVEGRCVPTAPTSPLAKLPPLPMLPPKPPTARAEGSTMPLPPLPKLPAKGPGPNALPKPPSTLPTKLPPVPSATPTKLPPLPPLHVLPPRQTPPQQTAPEADPPSPRRSSLGPLPDDMPPGYVPDPKRPNAQLKHRVSGDI